MKFEKHSLLEGQHAYLSASKHAWVNYDDEKFDRVYKAYQMAQRGTDLHDLASRAIKLGVKMPRNSKTINMYVNDAIGYRMEAEQILFYSFNCFGTADAICFRDNMLRIHDLKTGSTRVSMVQLEIYAALFCLEYDQNPNDIEIELRIYQNDQVVTHIPDGSDIRRIMDRIVEFDKRIESLKEAA